MANTTVVQSVDHNGSKAVLKGHSCTLQAKNPQLLISTTPSSPNSICPKMESFWFTAKDGTKLEGFLIRPPGFDPAKKYPVKFLIHGGPQGAWGDDWSYRWNAELFAANGYVVVMINLRGSTGYGQALWTALTATGAASPSPI